MPAEARRLWLIDAGYMIKAQESVRGGYRFSYLKLREYLERDGILWRAYYLNSTPNPPSDEQDAFHVWLRSAAPAGPKIITKLYKLKRTSVRGYCETCGHSIVPVCPTSPTHRLHRQQQKGVDVGLATLALIHAPSYDTLVLSSGDGDFLDAVEHLTENREKRFELLAFRGNARSGVSTELQARADKIYWINDFADEVAQDRLEPSPAPTPEPLEDPEASIADSPA